VLLGSVTTDLTIDVVERFNLLADARVLCSRWDWSEKLYAAGFAHALLDPLRLGEAWEKASAPGGVLSQWYEDPESLLYCVYQRASKPPAPRPEAESERGAEARNLNLVPLS